MDCLDIRGYPQPRFASEYGLQSLPRFQTLSNVTSTEDWSYFSPLMLHRQHHASGKYHLTFVIFYVATVVLCKVL